MIGNKIKQRRKELGYSADDVSKRIGVSRATMFRYENGTTDIPANKITAICSVLGCSQSWLFDQDIPFSDLLPWETSSEKATNIIPLPKMRRVPLLGTIACGEPILATENLEGEALIPDNIKADFALRCKGDSMINARIFDGDIVYIRQQPTVENGEIAAVLIDNEATLKRVKVFEDHITLEAENPQYRPMVYWGEEMNSVRILGKAVAFTSSLER